MTGWALWQIALVVALVLASLTLAGLALTRRAIPTFGTDEDEQTAEWVHRLVGPARVMADPVRVRLAMYTQLAAAQPRHARPQVVSGPAPAAPAPCPPSPPAAAAGPETHDDDGEPYETDEEFIASAGHLLPPWATARTVYTDSLPPVDQAAHLQPIDWADETGSFLAICEADHG